MIVGGEMVSLTLVESALKKAISNDAIDVIVVAIKDAKKDERLITIIHDQGVEPSRARHRPLWLINVSSRECTQPLRTPLMQINYLPPSAKLQQSLYYLSPTQST